MDKKDSAFVNAVSMSHTRKNVKISSARPFPLHNNNFFSFFIDQTFSIFSAGHSRGFLWWKLLHETRAVDASRAKKQFYDVLHNVHHMITRVLSQEGKMRMSHRTRKTFSPSKKKVEYKKCVAFSVEKVMFVVCVCVSERV
jgi:hypothetical protein